MSFKAENTFQIYGSDAFVTLYAIRVSKARVFYMINDVRYGTVFKKWPKKDDDDLQLAFPKLHR